MANIDDPGKKKNIRIKMTKVGAAPKKESGVDLKLHRGKEVSTYKPADVRTGDPRYGKESTTKDTPDFVKDAQAKKQDVVHKDGKPYRAGYTETVKHPDKMSVRIKVTPDIRPVKMTKTVTKPASEIREKNGTSNKRRLDRVAWLKGRNKRTESGYGG